MKRHILLIGLLVLVLVEFQPVQAQSPGWIDQLDHYLEARREAVGAPGMAVAIADQTGIVYSRGFGNVSPDTRFPVASLSKPVTAAAVLTLVEDGQVELDAPVQAYLPEFTIADPDVAARITVRHLLNQRSGLSDAGFPDLPREDPGTLEEKVAALAAAESTSEPGTTFAYFNANYDVLGRIIEVVSGQPYEAYVDAHVFTPLGMDSATFFPAAYDTNGHILIFGFPVAVPLGTEPAHPSGGIIATAEDMARFAQVYLNDGAPLFSPDLAHQALMPPIDGQSPYAMGWEEQTHIEDVQVVGHGGTLKNFRTDMMLLPEEGYGVVTLYNLMYLPAVFSSMPNTQEGLATRLAGVEAPGNGISSRAIGLTILGLMLVMLANNVVKLSKAKQWAQKHSRQTALRLAPVMLVNMLPLLIVVGMPQLLLVLTGRYVSYRFLFEYYTDIMLWLGAAGLLNVIVLGVRVYWLTRLRRSLPGGENQLPTPYQLALLLCLSIPLTCILA